MIINPRTAIKEGWITGIVDQEKQIQPNAIDFTLDRLFHVSFNNFIICVDPDTNKETKQMRGGSENLTVNDRRTGVDFFHIEGKTSYDAMSDVFVTIPEGVAALLITRSSYNRNSIFLTSGLYDSGFSNNIGFTLHNMSPGQAKIQKGMCVGQIIFIEAGTSHLYTGVYNQKPGEHHLEIVGKNK
ncbi:MAG: dCTP deaminase [Nitrosopumilaceae archaeon]